MTEYDTVDSYMETLRRALKLGRNQADEILEEVKGNLNDHWGRLSAEGLSDAQATHGALKELGNPYELAAKMQRVVIPKSGRSVNALRCAVVGLIALLFLPALFYFRSWEQIGFTPRLYLTVMGLVMPALLMTWPGIVWRRNWMFYIYPGAIVLLAAALLLGVFVGASETTTNLRDPSASDLGASAMAGTEEAGISGTSRTVIAAMCGMLVVVTFGMMQRKRQRLVAFAAMLLYCAVVEIPIQAEELVFRKQAGRMRQYVSYYNRQNDRYPGTEEASSDNRDLLGRTYVHMHEGDGGGGFSLSRHRMANRGFSLMYNSWDEHFISTD